MTDGVVAVDKPAGWTSHDVVAKSRGLLGTKKVGHAGTLDPSATGVLVLGVGQATRLLRYLGDLPKEYVGEIVLGTETSTLDAEGDVVRTHEMGSVTLDDVRAAAEGFVGPILQVPPMVSAVKVGGKRLHELARAGVEVEREARPVTVHALSIDALPEPGVFRITASCSGGTYVRVLAADIGIALGGGAHLRNLRRTAVGPYGLDEAVPLESLSTDRLLPPIEALRGRPRVIVDDRLAALVGHGRVFDDAVLGADGDGPWAVVDEAGALLAVYVRDGAGQVKPAVVLTGDKPHH
jgi:tRNA pseudouridine55 synthase